MADTILLGRVVSMQKSANIDWKYGPWSSINDAMQNLGPNGEDCIVEGLTVGIKTNQNVNTVEYWFQYNQSGNLELVPKLADEVDVDQTIIENSSDAVAGGAVYDALQEKQNTINSDNKLSADLIQNGETNKVVTQSEKDAWNNPLAKVTFVGTDVITGFPAVDNPDTSIIYACLKLTQDQGVNSAYNFYTYKEGNWQNISQGPKGDGNYLWIKYSEEQPTQDSDVKDNFLSTYKYIGFYNGNSASAPSDYTEYTWCKFMGTSPVVTVVQINGGNRVIITDEANPNGQSFEVLNGVDAVNPFKGWFTTANIPMVGQEGDYCYVSDTSVTPHTVTIYRWSTAQNAFVDTGEVPDTATGETFASGETLQQVAIDNSHLVNPVNTADATKPVLAKAEDVMQLKAKLDGVTARETKVQLITSGEGQNVFNGAIPVKVGSGVTKYKYYVWPNASSIKSVFVPLGSQDKYVRFLGMTASASVVTGIVFLNVPNGTSISSLAVKNVDCSQYVVKSLEWPNEDTPNDDTDNNLQFELSIPEGANYFVTICKSSRIQESDFYCYVGSGNGVIDACLQKVKPIFVANTPRKYISATSNKWVEINNDDIAGKFYNVQQYRGKFIRFYNLKHRDIVGATIPHVSCYAFVTTTDTTVGSTPSYCANYRLTAICEENVCVYIPNDAVYMWLYTRRYNRDVQPDFEIIEHTAGIAEYSTIDAYNMFVNAMRDKADELNLEMTIYDAAGYVYQSKNKNKGKGSSLARLFAIANLNPIINTIWSQKTKVTIKEIYHGILDYDCTSTIYVNDARHKALTDYYNILAGKTGSSSPYHLLGCIVQISRGRVLSAWIRQQGDETDSSSRYSEMKKVLDCAVDALDNGGNGISTIEATFNGVNSAQVYLLPSNYTPNYDFSDTWNNVYSYNPDVDLPIASNTKVLTLLTALDFVNDINTLVKVDPSDLISAQGGTDTSPVLATGDLFTLHDIMIAAMLPSANTAANAIAKHVGNILLNRQYVTNQH